MMKKLAALGITAAIAFTPIAVIAQTPTPEESASPAASSEPMKPMKHKPMHHKKMMTHHKMHKKAMKPAASPSESPTPSPSAT